jgi:predicted transcriptional regulator
MKNLLEIFLISCNIDLISTAENDFALEIKMRVMTLHSTKFYKLLNTFVEDEYFLSKDDLSVIPTSLLDTLKDHGESKLLPISKTAIKDQISNLFALVKDEEPEFEDN